MTRDDFWRAKRFGFSDRQLAGINSSTDMKVRSSGDSDRATGLQSVDTCAAEFEAYTPYYYSTYESENEPRPKATSRGS